MANDIQKLYNLPDISFIDGITIENVLNEMINDFQDKYYKLSGQYEVLGEFDKYRILINATSLKVYQAFQYINRTGKMNLLKYSTGDFLDHLGATRGIIRTEAKAAVCEVKFGVSKIQSSVIVIPKGTLITAGDNIYFETKEYGEIEVGKTEIIVPAECQIGGTIGNGYTIGTINTMVEPIPYVEVVENVNESNGGEDEQSDTSYREAIFLAPSGYSTAGPEDAYTYWAKSFSTKINDIKTRIPSEDTVQIIVLLNEGEIPDESFLNEMQAYLSNSNIKPMTELVTVTAPVAVSYEITGTYYINRSDKDNALAIQEKVTNAVDEYVNWQKAKIGRDLNPYHLHYLLMKAGIKRAELTSPVYANIDDTSVAVANNITLTYGGIEDD